MQLHFLRESTKRKATIRDYEIIYYGRKERKKKSVSTWKNISRKKSNTYIQLEVTQKAAEPRAMIQMRIAMKYIISKKDYGT